MKTLRTLIITIPAVRNISRNGEINLDDHSVYLIDSMDHSKNKVTPQTPDRGRDPFLFLRSIAALTNEEAISGVMPV
jgi:hypothetical protein